MKAHPRGPARFFVQTRFAHERAGCFVDLEAPPTQEADQARWREVGVGGSLL